MKLSGLVNYKTVFDIICEELFEGDYDSCEDWYYKGKVEGLDNMCMHDITSTPSGREAALVWCNGYLKGKRGDDL